MTTLVVGATGATGRLLVKQLLNRGEHVRIIVRTLDGLPDAAAHHDQLSITQASILDLSDAELLEQVTGCDAVASCLGHNLSFRGMFGQPRRLVTDATRRLCDAIKASDQPRAVRFVLMNTTGNSNRDVNEPISFAQKCVIFLLRALLPPHVDNEQAADHLRVRVGQHDDDIEWVVVRPDGLIDESEVSDYDIQPSPTRSAIFDAGKTSRINVAHFMAELIMDKHCWGKWQGKMPVIYNSKV